MTPMEAACRAWCAAEGVDPDLPCAGLGKIVPEGETWPAWAVRHERVRAAVIAYVRAIGDGDAELPERVVFAGIHAGRVPASPRGQAAGTFRAMCAASADDLAEHAGPAVAPRPGPSDTRAGNAPTEAPDAPG